MGKRRRSVHGRRRGVGFGLGKENTERDGGDFNGSQSRACTGRHGSGSSFDISGMCGSPAFSLGRGVGFGVSRRASFGIGRGRGFGFSFGRRASSGLGRRASSGFGFSLGRHASSGIGPGRRGQLQLCRAVGFCLGRCVGFCVGRGIGGCAGARADLLHGARALARP